jgi:hypothetical protein
MRLIRSLKWSKESPKSFFWYENILERDRSYAQGRLKITKNPWYENYIPNGTWPTLPAVLQSPKKPFFGMKPPGRAKLTNLEPVERSQ